jgi:ubiquinol-cytochrome c reductase cytochrome c1 subunit
MSGHSTYQPRYAAEKGLHERLPIVALVKSQFVDYPSPLTDGQVTFDGGAPNKFDDMARDVSALLAWTAEPKMEERKSTGFATIIYLAVLAVLVYLVKQRIWAKVDH